MSKPLTFYNLPHKLCSCRNEYNNLTEISRKYRIYYELLKKGKTSIEALNEMNIYRMCCRNRLLCIPNLIMLDRSEERLFDDSKKKIISLRTRSLEPKIKPPDFPLINF